VVIFIDNSEDLVVINVNEGAVLRGIDGVIFAEGDETTILNEGTIAGTGEATEAVIYFDRDADGALNTLTNTGTISNTGEDGDADAINFNGDPGTTGGEARGCLENDGALVLCQVEVNITNSGTISAARDNSSNAAIRVESDAVMSGTIANETGGTIIGAHTGININGAHSSHDLTISNAGNIEGTSGDGVLITGAGVTLNNLAGGVITGGDAGVQVASTTITIDIGPSNLNDVAVAAVNNTFVNAGTISGTRASVDLTGAGEAVTFEQRGGALTGDFLGSSDFMESCRT